MTTTVSGSSITFNDNTTQNTSAYGGGFAMRNRIINGDMRIDQRNAGSAVTADGAFPLDRWKIILGGGGALSAQRSTTAPAGYTNSLYITATTADTSLGTSDEYSFRHAIEGFNVADLGWGTANAQTITLSFKVRSSVTGTYGGVLRNSAADRLYVFSYTVNSANTWEDKSVTIVGDTSGTWLTDNGIGIQLIFSLGAGSSRLASAGSWGSPSGGIQGVTGQTQWISTLNATFYITGVQLEKGSTATSFDYRPYGQELANCQRYYQTLPFDAGYVAVGAAIATGAARGPLFQLNVNMRAAPTVTLPAAGSGAGQLHYTTSSGAVPGTIGTNSVLGVQVNSFRVEGDSYTSAFTTGNSTLLRVGAGAGASITASAEL